MGAPEFEVTYTSTGSTLSRASFLSMTADLLKSFPDLVYIRRGPIAYANDPFTVVWIAVQRGTLSGAPYSPMAGLTAVAAKDPPVECTSDPETFTATVRGSIIKRLVVSPSAGSSSAKGYSVPIGFYLQAGGEPSNLPSTSK